jgi:hypothetical protein
MRPSNRPFSDFSAKTPVRMRAHRAAHAVRGHHVERVVERRLGADDQRE